MIQHILQLVISVIQIFRQQGKITDSPQLALHKIFFQSITFFIEHIIWYYDEVVNDCKAFVFVHSQDTSTALNELAWISCACTENSLFASWHINPFV